MPENKDKVIQRLEDKEEQPKEKNWLETLPIGFKIGGAAALLIGINSMMQTQGVEPFSLLVVVVIIIILYSIGKNLPEAATLVDPKEADSLVELEFNRKYNWNQFAPGTEINLLPQNNIIHRDARGMYYDVPVEVTEPFRKRPVYYSAKVMMKDKERGFVVTPLSLGIPTGRDILQEKTILPEIFKAARRDKFVENWIKKYT